jgi:hypothetical protein
MDLGPDPEQYIEYPGGNGFYIKEAVEERLRRIGASYSDEELERLFIPFLDPHIRRIVERFSGPRRSVEKWRRCSKGELLGYHRALHPFDKRRLHYLRFGRVDIGDLDARPWKFLNVLLDKSRDEIEQLFDGMEQELPPQEIRTYLYTALHLQTHFKHLLIRNHPAALDPEKVDHYFVEDLCRLNRDDLFFSGVDRRGSDTLHPYLIKYLVLYFDHAFDPRTVWGEYVHDFVWRHRFYRPPGNKKGMSLTEREACRTLGIAQEDFGVMDRGDLTQCFRRLAMETNPDKGGEKGRFIKIKEAYECLLRLKQ